MNKKEIRKHRLALSLSVTIYIFVILLISVLISFLGVTILISLNKIPVGANGQPEPKSVLLFMSFISLIVGIIVTGLTSQVMLKYVNCFINQMNRLASGDFKARLSYGKPLSNHPTFAEITNSFNLMAEELEHTEVLRSDFINNFSHEFKTPIVSIAGFAKLLKYEELTDGQRIEYLDVIEEEAMRLSAMATNVLNMSKVENQMILTDVSTFNLSEQIRSCVLLLEKPWTKKNIEFSLEFDEYEICANEELLKQIWINLLDNAIKFSSANSIIKIETYEKHNKIFVSVKDHGIGIPKESLKQIWSRFYKTDLSRGKDKKGTGLGLSIAKEIIQSHNENINVISTEGVGTEFIFSLPIVDTEEEY